MITMNISNDEFWIVTQICDSGFPGGALAHSQGLESALSHGLISINDETENELIKFVNLSIIQANNQLIPILLNAWKVSYNCKDDDNNDWLNNIKSIDEKCQLVLNNNVSRRSSINQGKCFLRASKEAFFNNNNNNTDTSNHEKIQQLSKIIHMKTDDDNNNNIYGHYPTIFGLVCGFLNISELITKKIFFRCFVRDLFSSAYRLNIIGPLEGANLQAIVCKNLERNLLMNDNYNNNDNNNDNDNDNNDEYISKKRKAIDIDDNNNDNNNTRQVPVTTVPILEILQGRHDLLYCRLFNS